MANKGKLNLVDAYKTVCFGVRSLIAIGTGNVVGGIDTDESIGKAMAEVKHPKDFAEEDTLNNVILHALAGIWVVLGSPANRRSRDEPRTEAEEHWEVSTDGESSVHEE